MSALALNALLTGVAAVIVMVTRLRLGSGFGHSARQRMTPTVVWAHFVVGLLAVIGWSAFLVAGEDTWLGGSLAGVIALGLWWVVSVLGLMILLRWWPTGGQRVASQAQARGGPWLSLLAHLGMVVVVAVFTWCYVTAAV